ncbi:TrlF family AAA-like ATPase [Desulfobacterota bacterium M19]
MDNGNHYKKCDLQVHSPRDRNWQGGNKVTDEERKEYSKKFIKECRDAGLSAVAISDHHDMVFFEYIKIAANEELDEIGNPISGNERIVIFPGIELTLSTPPCQGLVIFDADFPENLFPTVLGCLSLAQAPKSDSKTSQTVAIPSSTINSINDIYSKLDGTDGVKGRYIFLPHVKEKGHQTLMRKGFHEAYSKMPCVGGYVDGAFNDGGSGSGYNKIINGEVDAYGFKSIAVIQTTDYRGDKTLKDINIATWIKWKEPTAEALRQACLAKESRISLSEPEIPNIFIEKIDVTNSAFLSKFELDFNPQLNSIIGGRGSGKSTILEYLRWALCDQTETFGKDSEKSEIERKRNTLIEKTLKGVGGEVRVFFNVNNTRHIIKRNPNSEDVLLKVGEGEFQSVRPQQIEDLLPIQAYSQKQLSSISIKPDELKRFIEQPIAKAIEEIDIKIEESSLEVKTSYENLSKNKLLQTELKKSEIEIDSFKQQIEKLRSGLKGISDEDKSVLHRDKYYVNEKNRFDEVDLEYSTVKTSIQSLKEILLKYKDQVSYQQAEYENSEIIDPLNGERNRYFTSLLETLESVEVGHDKSKNIVSNLHQKWKDVRDKFKSSYTKAKENSTASQTTLNAIKELEGKIEKLELMVREKRAQLSSLSMTDDDFKGIYKKYIVLQSSKIEKLKESSKSFSGLSDGLIDADFTKTIDSNKLSQDLISVFSAYSLKIPKTKSENLSEQVSSSSKPLDKWLEIIFEIKSLNEFRLTPEVQEDLPHTPVLDNAGFTLSNRKSISDGMSSDGVLRLATTALEFLPKFYYQTHNQMGDKVPFEDASAGQQATALLNVLLSQEGFPLIIDQPEDDIDNRAIEKIIKNIWNAKKKRQIIISSHNANLVVNGDTELVICCDYNETSEQTKGQIKHEGSIDNLEIRNEITSIMEGGERAFKLRKEKYGF